MVRKSLVYYVSLGQPFSRNAVRTDYRYDMSKCRQGFKSAAALKRTTMYLACGTFYEIALT